MSVVSELKGAVRTALKYRLTTSLAIVSIALGIGMTTGVFTLADGLLLRPLPIERPDGLFEVTSIGEDGGPFTYGWTDYEDMLSAESGVSALVAYQRRGGMLANPEGGSDLVLVSPVSANYFPVLGVRPVLGHNTLENVEGRPEAVLGWRLWQRRFGGDPNILGATIVLGGHALFIAGVMPREFGGLERGVSNDIWVSSDTWFDVLQRGSRQSRGDQFEVVARLQPGTKPAVVADRLDTAIRRAGAHKPAPAGAPGTILKARFGGGWTSNLKLSSALLGILALMLFVACANVAQLRLAQTEARRKELALRKALGAADSRIVGQLLAETSVVAIPGLALGLLFADTLVDKAMEFLPPQSIAVGLDRRVLLFAGVAMLLSLLIAGLSPVRLAAEIRIAEALKGQQGVAGGRSAWWRNFFMAGQVAISVTLVGTTLLFMGSLREAAKIQPGFDSSRNFLIVEAVPGLQLKPLQWAEQVCDRLATLPGARAATFARRLPLGNSGGAATVSVNVPGQGARAVKFNNVAGNYFSVLRPSLVAGRGIDTNDRENTEPVAVVSQRFAQQFFGGRDPIGQTIMAAPVFSKAPPKAWRIVGLVADAPTNDLHEKIEPYLFFAYAQMPVDDLTIVLETAKRPASLTRAMIEEIRRFDPKALLYGQTTMENYIAAALTPDRLMSAAANTLGFFSLVLMAAGLFGALHYTVSRRTRELGLRVALGAMPGQIRGLILGEALRMGSWGVAVGFCLLATVATLVRALVVGISIADVRLYLGGATIVLVVVVTAAWLPARRAMRLQPMDALRAD